MLQMATARIVIRYFIPQFLFPMSAFQIVRDFGELGERGLEVFDDFGGDYVGI